jgi:hypothetical protein
MSRVRTIAGALALTGAGSLLFGAPSVLGGWVAVASFAAVGLGGALYGVLHKLSSPTD